jgi:hypothetical protein
MNFTQCLYYVLEVTVLPARSDERSIAKLRHAAHVLIAGHGPETGKGVAAHENSVCVLNRDDGTSCEDWCCCMSCGIHFMVSKMEDFEDVDVMEDEE